MPAVPTACRARWSIRRSLHPSAGRRAPPCARGWPRPTGGTLTTSCPSDRAPSPEATIAADHLAADHLATDHLVDDIGRRSRRGGAILLVAQAVRVLGQ